MIYEIEVLTGLGIAQIGLLLDIVGFIIIFVFGGFTFGVSAYVRDKISWHVLPLRVLGLAMVIIGFTFQFFGSGI